MSKKTSNNLISFIKENDVLLDDLEMCSGIAQDRILDIVYGYDYVRNDEIEMLTKSLDIPADFFQYENSKADFRLRFNNLKRKKIVSFISFFREQCDFGNDELEFLIDFL